MLENIRKHNHLLGLYIGTTLSLINNGHKPLADSFWSFLQALQAFIKKTKQETNNHVLLDKIWKAADASARCKTFIEEQITILKNSISAPAFKPTYANIAS